MWNIFAPELDWVFGINGGQGDNCMVFGGYNCWFRCVDAAIVLFRHLDVCSLELNVFFHHMGAFVVKDLEGWVIPFDI